MDSKQLLQKTKCFVALSSSKWGLVGWDFKRIISHHAMETPANWNFLITLFLVKNQKGNIASEVRSEPTTCMLGMNTTTLVMCCQGRRGGAHPHSRSTPPTGFPDTACTLCSRSSSHRTDGTGTAPATHTHTQEMKTRIYTHTVSIVFIIIIIVVIIIIIITFSCTYQWWAATRSTISLKKCFTSLWCVPDDKWHLNWWYQSDLLPMFIIQRLCSIKNSLACMEAEWAMRKVNLLLFCFISRAKKHRPMWCHKGPNHLINAYPLSEPGQYDTSFSCCKEINGLKFV